MCVHSCACVCVCNIFTIVLFSIALTVSGTSSGMFLTATVPVTASEVLKKYEKEFLSVVNAKQSLFRLKRVGVISEDVKTDIEGAKNEENAKEILYDHLSSNATVATLREWCDVAIEANGYPKMQELGRKMKEALSQGGWLELYKCMCECNCVM